jgi:hypothetical protein
MPLGRVVLCAAVISIMCAACVFAAAGVDEAPDATSFGDAAFLVDAASFAGDAASLVEAESLPEAAEFADSHIGAVSVTVNKSRWNRFTPETFRRSLLIGKLLGKGFTQGSNRPRFGA